MTRDLDDPSVRSMPQGALCADCGQVTLRCPGRPDVRLLFIQTKLLNSPTPCLITTFHLAHSGRHVVGARN